MSGEPFSGFAESYEINERNVSSFANGTNYQLESLYLGRVKKAAGFTEKLLTTEKKDKLKEEYYSGKKTIRDHFQEKLDKYALHAVCLGAVSFDKLRPVYVEREERFFEKPKGSKVEGYCVGSARFKTLTEAKKYAKARFMNGDLTVPVCKLYTNSHGRKVASKQIGFFTGEKTGEMKSMPKTMPKSFIVCPKYLYWTEGCLTDHEYEYM